MNTLIDGATFRCYASEIEPKYVDVAVKRWEQYTGKKAKRDKIR